MGWLAKIFGGNIGNVGDLFSKIVGSFKLSPEKAAELEALKQANQQKLAELDIQLQQQAADAITKEIEAASANIRAEAQTGDKYTSRARPSFIYVMLAIFLSNYMIFPLVGRQPIAYPEPLFWLFGSCMLGYTGARTWEKIGLAKGGNA